MKTAGNRQVVLPTRPDGIPQAEHSALREVVRPEPATGQFLVHDLYLSINSTMRD